MNKKTLKIPGRAGMKCIFLSPDWAGLALWHILSKPGWASKYGPMQVSHRYIFLSIHYFYLSLEHVFIIYIKYSIYLFIHQKYTIIKKMSLLKYVFTKKNTSVN